MKFRTDRNEERNMVDYEAFGRRVRRERIKCGMSQEELAKVAGVSGKHISNIETGKTVAGIDVVLDITNALDTSLDLLFADSLTYTNQQQCSEIGKELAGCTSEEAKYINETIRTVKLQLRSYDKNVKKKYKRLW